MPDVQMDFDMMEEMARLFREGVDQLGDTIESLRKIADGLEDGDLLGQGGDVLADQIRGNFVSKVSRLQDKLEELNGDIYGALVDLRDGDTDAKSRFKD